MKLLEKILVPLAANSPSDQQIDLAVNLAQKFNSEIIMLYVLPREAKLNSISELVGKYIKNEVQENENRIKELQIRVKSKIKYGNRFDQIISFAEDEDVNLILISDLSNEKDGDYNIDVYAEKILRKSEIPVWLLKKGDISVPETILCPIDFSDASERALTNAIKIARIFDAEVNILNVFEPLQQSFTKRLDIDLHAENKRLEEKNVEEFNQFMKKFNLINLKYSIKLLEGNPIQEIINFSKNNNIDVVFIGATGKSYLQRLLLGSVTELLIRELPCSILVTKSENILNLKIDSDISNLEKHFELAEKLKEMGYYKEAIKQLKICLRINDLHIPTFTLLIKLYELMEEHELSEKYKKKVDEILKRLWDKKIEFEIRKTYRSGK
ncbi:MAG: universal stress protein [Marinifilum sp.]|jgi:nucleotide-binding universal stress UspA family protein|nr:universal stress protein [Marinifilum sp.]